MERDMDCLRCNQKMKYMMTERLQLGQTGWILGDLSNLLSGALEVDIYSCSECGKIEFFVAHFLKETEEIKEQEVVKEEVEQQKKCPVCGRLHDVDVSQCPFCQFCYPNLDWTK